LNAIREYIATNPLGWLEGKENPAADELETSRLRADLCSKGFCSCGPWPLRLAVIAF